MGWFVNYEIKFIGWKDDDFDDEEFKKHLNNADICDYNFIFLRNEEDDILNYDQVCIISIYCGAFTCKIAIGEVLNILWNLYKIQMEYRKYGELEYKKFKPT
jgi:hypothetical protein